MSNAKDDDTRDDTDIISGGYSFKDVLSKVNAVQKQLVKTIRFIHLYNKSEKTYDEAKGQIKELNVLIHEAAYYMNNLSKAINTLLELTREEKQKRREKSIQELGFEKKGGL